MIPFTNAFVALQNAQDFPLWAAVVLMALNGVAAVVVTMVTLDLFTAWAWPGKVLDFIAKGLDI